MHDKEHSVSESRESVWLLTIAPSVWVVHFMACYLTNALWCAKFADSSSDPNFVRWAMVMYTMIALPVIAGVGWMGWRREQSRPESDGPHDRDTHRDRHSFIGFAMLLLAGLSAIATTFVGLVAVLVEGC